MNFEQFLNESSNIKVGDMVSKKFASTEDDYTRTFKVVAIKNGKSDLEENGSDKKTTINLNDLLKESDELQEAGSQWDKYGDMDIMGLTKAQTKKVAELYAKAISKDSNNVVKYTVNMKTLDDDAFDLDANGDEYAGGSYNIYANNEVVNHAVNGGESYGKYNDSVDTIVKNIKKLAESLEVNESKITLKRQYTESHPAQTVGKHATIRNKIIETLKDSELTREEFDSMLSGLTEDSKRWLRRNSYYFNVQEDKVTLTKTGQRVAKSLKPIEDGYRPMTSAEKQKKQYTDNQVARLRGVDKNKAEGERLRALQQKLHKQKQNENIMMKTNFIHESFTEFVEVQLNKANKIDTNLA